MSTHSTKEPTHAAPTPSEPDEWSEWKASWTSNQNDISLLDTLRKKTERKQRQRLLSLWAEICASGLIVAFYLNLWTRPKTQTAPIYALGAGSILFVIIWMFYVLRTFRQTYTHVVHTTTEYTQALCIHTKARLQHFQRTHLVLYWMLGFVLLWSPWMYWNNRMIYTKEPWRAILGFGGFFCIWIALFFFNRWKQSCIQKEYTTLLQFHEELQRELEVQ